jgi:4-hydroxy-tetrahydrodipicolinate reductase
VTQVVLLGSAGRMGRALMQALSDAGDLTLKACVDRPGVASPPDGGAPWGHDLAEFVAPRDVVIEFSGPAAAAQAADLCAQRGAGLVSGTTGLEESQEAAFRVAARATPVVRAANFSLGVLALRRALAAVLEAVPAHWDVEIVERHHRAKQDAPSGTALELARLAARRRGYPESALRAGRSGLTGVRPQAEIGIHALRGGSWVGDHSIVLAGAGESIELRHVAQDRSAFAHGALAAARFVATAPPGFYTLEEVVSAAAR